MTKQIGAKHHAAKMNAAKVRQARKSFDTGKWTKTALARKYGITVQSMSAILRREAWKHVT